MRTQDLRRLKWLIALACLAILPGCFPGQCDGAFRFLSASGEAGEVARADRSTVALIGADAEFYLGADSKQATPPELLTRANINPKTWFLVGPFGPIEAEITSKMFVHAHSCANAASFSLKPKARLAAGSYTLVVLLGGGWPAVSDDDVARYEGKPAMVRRYIVK